MKFIHFRAYPCGARRRIPIQYVVDVLEPLTEDAGSLIKTYIGLEGVAKYHESYDSMESLRSQLDEQRI